VFPESICNKECLREDASLRSASYPIWMKPNRKVRAAKIFDLVG